MNSPALVSTLRTLAFFWAVSTVGPVANAQDFPSRPITIGMPFAAGGSGDTIARILAERMRVPLDRPVIVENITGAGGSIGTSRVARATPDGYTLILGNWATHVVNGAALALKYDVLNDFEPVSLIASQPMLIVAKNGVPAMNLKELIAWLKANPGKASQGTAGAGSATHIAGVFFQNETGTRLPLVTYRGSAPAMQDLVAGQIDLIIDLPGNSLSQARAGTVKALAVTAKSRLAAAQEIPTVDEAGLPGFYISVWYALWAPKGTPRDVIGKLNAAVKDALSNPTVRHRLADRGNEIPPPDQQTPEALGAFHRAEIKRWWPIIKAANIKAE